MILIVQSLWNEAVTDKLVEGAQHILQHHDIPFQLVQVPGALEIPLTIAAAKAKFKTKLKGVIACGTVVKGDTYHFEVVANESARGLTDVSLKTGLPIGNAILACYDIDQALARAGGKHGNKGEEAAESVLAMLEVLKFSSPGSKKEKRSGR